MLLALFSTEAAAPMWRTSDFIANRQAICGAMKAVLR
jgi:hypothetical protein